MKKLILIIFLLMSACTSATPKQQTIMRPTPTYDGSGRLMIYTNDTTYDCSGKEIPGVTVEASNVTVRNCIMRDAVGTGIFVRGKNNKFENITIESVALSEGSGADADGVRFFGSGHIFDGIVINLGQAVEPSHQDCFQSWGDYTHEAASDVIIKNSICNNPSLYMVGDKNHKSQGIQIENGVHDITIINNVFRAYRAVNIGDPDDTEDTYNIFICNNTFVGGLPLPEPTVNQWGIFITTGNQVTACNNIFLDIGGEHLFGNITAQNNLVYRSDNGRLYGEPSFTDLWSVNPLLDSMYKPRPGSPVCGRGTNGVDIGAYPCVVPSTATPTNKPAEIPSTTPTP